VSQNTPFFYYACLSQKPSDTVGEFRNASFVLSSSRSAKRSRCGPELGTALRVTTIGRWPTQATAARNIENQSKFVGMVVI